MNADTKFLIIAVVTGTVLAAVILLLPLLALQSVLGDGPWMMVPAVLLSIVWLKAVFVACDKIDVASR